MPFDGEPHPEHPPVVLGPNVQNPNWENEQNGAAPNLGFFGDNPHPHHVQNQIQEGENQNMQNPGGNDMLINDNAPEEDPEDHDDDPWPEWNPIIFAAND